MAINSYFFNAVLDGQGGYDRVYNSEDVTSYLDLIVGDGVFPNPSNQLQVVPNSDMTITVKAGSGWIQGHKMVNTADMNLTLEASDALLNRIDAVIFYVDYTAREMGIEVKQGTGASVPVAPTLTRDASRYEMCLAQIAVNKQVTVITAAMITDTRPNSSLCGWVAGLIQQLDTTGLWQQFETEFDDWFGTVKDTLSTATLLRRYEGNYTTLTPNESVFDVSNYVPQYSYALDILEVRINGLTLNTNEYSTSGTIVTLDTPIAKAGTPISFAVYKSVDGSDAETVIEQVAELQEVVGTIETGVYIATGEDDNKKLSQIVNAFYDGGNDYRQLELDVYGDLSVTEPTSEPTNSMYPNTKTAIWFDFSSADDSGSTRRVKLNFAHASRIIIDGTGFDVSTVFDAENRSFELSNLQLVANNVASGNVFGAGTDPTVEDCAFWLNGTGSGNLTGALQGCFDRCRMSVTNGSGVAYGFSANGGVLRLRDCEIIAYNNSSSSSESVAVQVQGNQTNNVLVMDGCSCPIRARGGYKQSNVVKVNSGFFCLTANMLGKAALLYSTGDGKTELGTMIVSK